MDDNENNKLGLKSIKNNTKYIDTTKNLSNRSYAILTINKNNKTLTLEEQIELVEKVNTFIQNQRIKYNSLFLTNYREKNRKRISFDLSFKIINYILSSS